MDAVTATGILFLDRQDLAPYLLTFDETVTNPLMVYRLDAARLRPGRPVNQIVKGQKEECRDPRYASFKLLTVLGLGLLRLGNCGKATEPVGSELVRLEEGGFQG